MKRYLVFAGYDYYPSGGWRDYHSEHDDKAEAVYAAETIDDDPTRSRRAYDWAEVVDMQAAPADRVVFRYEREK